MMAKSLVEKQKVDINFAVKNGYIALDNAASIGESCYLSVCYYSTNNKVTNLMTIYVRAIIQMFVSK